MSFTKLPAIEGHVACGTCSAGPLSRLRMDRVIAVGFGSAGYMKDGDCLWEEGCDDETFPTAADVEAIAEKEPDHDWRIFFHAPLYDAEYQRHGPGEWVLISKGPGFA